MTALRSWSILPGAPLGGRLVAAGRRDCILGLGERLYIEFHGYGKVVIIDGRYLQSELGADDGQIFQAEVPVCLGQQPPDHDILARMRRW